MLVALAGAPTLCRRAGRNRERLAGAALRQPQVRPGQCARRARPRTTTSPGSTAAPACRSRSPPNSRTGAASATGKARRAGSITRSCPAGAPRWWSQPKGKDELVALRDKPDAQPRRRRQAAGRRARHRQALQRQLVPHHRRGLRRLDRAGAAVGRLSGREGGLDASDCRRTPARSRAGRFHPRECRMHPREVGASYDRRATLEQRQSFASAAPRRRCARPRSPRARPAGLSTITSVSGMSTSSFSPSTKKW